MPAPDRFASPHRAGGETLLAGRGGDARARCNVQMPAAPQLSQGDLPGAPKEKGQAHGLPLCIMNLCERRLVLRELTASEQQAESGHRYQADRGRLRNNSRDRDFIQIREL